MVKNKSDRIERRIAKKQYVEKKRKRNNRRDRRQKVEGGTIEKPCGLKQI